jgi:hypothetical protein
MRRLISYVLIGRTLLGRLRLLALFTSTTRCLPQAL